MNLKVNTEHTENMQQARQHLEREKQGYCHWLFYQNGPETLILSPSTDEACLTCWSCIAFSVITLDLQWLKKMFSLDLFY